MPQAGQVITTYDFHEDGSFRELKTQDCEEIMKGIHNLSDIAQTNILKKSTSKRYVGSVPSVLALAWAQEAGVRLFSKEWLEVAAKKLKYDPNFKRLRMEF